MNSMQAFDICSKHTIEDEAVKMIRGTQVFRWMMCVLIFFLIGTTGRMNAQVLYGTIVGTVTDQNGAVIPGATITATQSGTDTALAATTGADGAYTISNAPSGSYTVKFEKEGFQNFIAQNIALGLNATARVNGRLQVGSVSQSVTVSASAVQLQTDSADVHHDLDSEELVNLPAPVRSYQALIGTMPGAAALGVSSGSAPSENGGTNNPTKGLSVSFNGTSNANTDFRIEGVSAVDAWVPWDSTARPSVEAIQTVNVVAGTSNVEQGLASGAVVNVLLKSGSNQFHGESYWYHTDQDLAARPYFSDPASPKNKAIENDFGGTIGGPILKNKLFFFASYEGDFTRSSQPAIGTVPLPSVLAGNFQQLLSLSGNPDPNNGSLCNPVSGKASPCIFDPTTGNPDGTGRSPFFATPGTNPECPSGTCYNMIPTSRFSPATAKLNAMVPAPNHGAPGALSNNYLGSEPSLYNLDLIDGKVDWNASKNLRVSGRLEIDPYNSVTTPLFGNKLGTGQNGGFVLGNQNGKVSAFTGSATYTVRPTLLIDGGFGFTRSNQLLSPVGGNQKYTSDVLGIPGTNLGDLPYAGGLATQTIGCGIYYDNWFCGGQYTGYGYAYPGLQYLDPVFTYFGNVTNIKGKHTFKFGFNVINIHMNHVEKNPDVIAYDGGVTSDADPNQPYTLATGLTTPYNSYADFILGAPTSVYTFELNQIGGNKKTVLRTSNESLYFGDTWAASPWLTISYGTGWEYYPVPTHGSHGMEDFLPSANGTGTYVVCGYGAIPKDCGARVSKLLFTPRAGFAFRPMHNFVIRGGYSISHDQFNMARNPLYNFPEVLGATVSSAFSNPYFPVTTLEAGVPAPVSPDYSQGVISPLPPGSMGSNTNFPINYVRGYVESYNLAMQKTFGSWSAQAGYVGTHSIHMYQSYDMNYCPVGASGNCNVFYPTFGTNSVSTGGPLGSSHYNGLQTILQRSFSNGYNISANYTYSQLLGICCNSNFGSSQIADPRYFNLSRGLEPFDVTHSLNITGTVQSPFGKGRAFARGGGPTAAILGGWQLNGVFEVRSGYPFSISAGSISAGNSQLASYANGASPGHVKYPKTLSHWFDPTNFTAIPICAGGGTTCFGNVRFDSLRGPGAKNLDLSLFREIGIKELFKTQFRVEAFNLTNTPHWGLPNTSIGSAGFGSISGVAGVGRLVDQRYLRLGVKLMF